MIFKILILVLGVMLLAGIFRTWQIQASPSQEIFLKGLVPSPKLDGLYRGIFVGHNTSWKGKKLNAAESNGINIFAGHNTAPGSNGQVEKYPFKTYVGKGLLDKNLDVLKIDYNVSGNPWWLKFIVDEVVQTAPGEYLGKMQLNIIPGIPFGVLYFELKK